MTEPEVKFSKETATKLMRNAVQFLPRDAPVASPFLIVIALVLLLILAATIVWSLT